MRLKIRYLIILGIITVSGFGSYHRYQAQISARDDRPALIRQENKQVQTAINRLAREDTGEAHLMYYRKGHILAFSVNDYNVRGKFSGKNLQQQMRYFKRCTRVFDAVPQVSLTKSAIRHHQIQLNEQTKQRKENHREAVEAVQKAQQQAKEKADKAKADAKKKARREQAEQRKRQQALDKKKAEQHEAQAKSHQNKKPAHPDD